MAQNSVRPFQPPAPWFNNPAVFSTPPATAGTAYTLNASSGNFSAAGAVATLVVARVLSAAPGAVAVTGDSATPNAAVTAAPGSATVTGTVATLAINRVLSAAAGSVTVTGVAATPATDIPASPTTVSISGASASLVIHRVTTASPASVAITGNAVTLKRFRGIIASPGVVSISGTGASFIAPTPAPPVNTGSSATGGRTLEDELYALLRNDDEIAALVTALI